MIQRLWVGLEQNGGGGGCHVAVNQHGHVVDTRAQNGACHGCQFTPAQAAQHFEWIVQMCAMQVHRAAYGVGFAFQAFGVNACAGPHPVFRLSTEQAMCEGSRNGGIPNAHFSNAQEVTTIGYRFHAIGHGGGTVLFAEGGLLRDVACRKFQGQFKYLEAKIKGLADLVDRSTIVLEIRHHLCGHCLRISCNALRHHAVIACKHCDHRTLDTGRRALLPGCQPFHDILQTAQRTGGLGQLRVAFPNLGHRIQISFGHGRHERADIVEGKAAWHGDTFQESQSCKNVCGFWAGLGADVNAIEDPATAMNDPTPISPATPSRFRPLAEFVHALKFLTRLPVPFSRTIDPPPFNQTLRMFSVVGALIGCGIALALLAGKYLYLPAMLAAVLAVAAGMLVTGALHEDGLADTADGLGGGKTRERRLEIMRDSRIGSYGTLALIVAVGTRVSCYAALLPYSPEALFLVIVACQSFSRALMVDLLWATRPARLDGLSVYAGQPTRSVALSAIAVGLLLTLLAGYYTQVENAVLALGLGLAVTAGIRQLAMRLIGGQTGDVCGAVQVTCEMVMLSAFVATLR